MFFSSSGSSKDRSSTTSQQLEPKNINSSPTLNLQQRPLPLLNLGNISSLSPTLPPAPSAIPPNTSSDHINALSSARSRSRSLSLSQYQWNSSTSLDIDISSSSTPNITPRHSAIPPEVFHEEVKNYWKLNRGLQVTILKHVTHNCLEIIARDASDRSAEASNEHIFVDYVKLIQKCPQSLLQEEDSNGRKRLSSPVISTNKSSAVKNFMAKYIMDRITIDLTSPRSPAPSGTRYGDFRIILRPLAGDGVTVIDGVEQLDIVRPKPKHMRTFKDSWNVIDKALQEEYENVRIMDGRVGSDWTSPKNSRGNTKPTFGSDCDYDEDDDDEENDEVVVLAGLLDDNIGIANSSKPREDVPMLNTRSRSTSTSQSSNCSLPKLDPLVSPINSSRNSSRLQTPRSVENNIQTRPRTLSNSQIQYSPIDSPYSVNATSPSTLPVCSPRFPQPIGKLPALHSSTENTKRKSWGYGNMSRENSGDDNVSNGIASMSLK